MQLIITIILFVAYWVTGKKSLFKKGGGKAGGKGKGGGESTGGKGGKGAALVVHWLRSLLWFGAMCSLVSIPLTWFGWGSVGTLLGGWIAGFLGWALGWTAITGTQATTALLVIAFGIAVWDIACDRKVDKPAFYCLTVIPVLTMVAVGPVANITDSVTGSVREATASISGLVQ